eukprot:9365070-Pyramimonas_sp.AAC.1
MARPFTGLATSRIEPAQLGTTAKRAARYATAMIEDIFRRFQIGARHAKKSKIMVGVLADLEKAFDLPPRDAIWAEVHRLVESA